MKKMLPEPRARPRRALRPRHDRGPRHRPARRQRLASRNTGPAKLAADRPAAADARPLADARHLRRRDPGARRRRAHLLRLRRRPRRRSQLKLDMARQCWDEARHCEISVKLGDHMGTEIGEFAESTFLYAAACNPDPVLRLTGVNRALEGLAIDVFNTMKEFGDVVGRPGARVLRGLDARRRGHPREDGLRLAAPAHRRTTPSGASGRSSSSASSTSSSPSAASAARTTRTRSSSPAASASSPASPTTRSTSSPRSRVQAQGRARRRWSRGAARPRASRREPSHASRPTRSRWSSSTRPRSRRSSRTRPRSSGFPPDVDDRRRGRRGAVRTRSTGHASTSSTARRRSGSRAATSRTRSASRQFSADSAAVDLAQMLLRAKDRLSDDFARRAARRRAHRRQRTAWDVYADGRAPAGSGYRCGDQRALYDFRLQHGFTDVADAAFERLWDAPTLDLGRHPRDLQGDRRRRPRPESKSPASTSSARTRRPERRSGAHSQVVGARSGRRGRSSGGSASRVVAAVAIVDHDSASRGGPLGRVGRLPLLDHQEAARLRGRRQEVDVAAARARRGSARRTGPGPRRARPPGPATGVERRR